VILLLFTLGLVLSTWRIAWRLVRFIQTGTPVPRLLPRDLTFFTGMLLPFLLILGARGLGLGEEVRGQLWWILLTGVPAVIAVGVFTFYEWFVIER
jgi:hypothetical protein